MFLSQSNLKILYDALDEYTKQASQNAVIPPELETYKFSKKFETKMQRLINRRKKSYYMLIDTVGKRVAGYVLIALVCLFTTIFSVKALREPFINFVVETYEKFTSIFVQKDDTNIAKANVEFEIILPTYIPEGYERSSFVVDDDLCMCVFKNVHSKEILYTQHLNGFSLTTIDAENVVYKHMRINSFEGIYYINNDLGCMVFGNDKYTFNISGYISKEEIIKIVESIEIK